LTQTNTTFKSEKIRDYVIIVSDNSLLVSTALVLIKQEKKKNNGKNEFKLKKNPEKIMKA
jgi:hypothetical protein